MSVKKCANCEQIVGNLERYHLYLGKYVCETCKSRLDEQEHLLANNNSSCDINDNIEGGSIDNAASSDISEIADVSKRRKRGNYLVRHWRGELPLSVSFWINCVLLNFLEVAFSAWFEEVNPIANPVVAARIAIILYIFSIIVVYPWQIIGVWRSCESHIWSTGKSFWSRTTQILVIVGFLFTLGNVTNSFPLYKSLFRIGFLEDEYANYTLDLIKEGTIIHLQGGLGLGVSEDVKKLLEKHSDIVGIVLDTAGGWTYEGRELNKLISSYGLDTYSVQGCCSSGTLAFIAGYNRYLCTGANLAFHQYSLGYEGLENYVDLEEEQRTDLILFREQGVKEEFLQKIYAASSDDFWYPTMKELLDSGVIHGIIKPSDILPVSYDSSTIGEVEEAFSNISFYSVLKRHDPVLYNELLVKVSEQMKQGATLTELIETVSVDVVPILLDVLPQTSNKAATQFGNELIAFIKDVKEKDPFMCLKLLYPQDYGRIVRSPDISPSVNQSLLDSMAFVYSEAYENPGPEVDVEGAELFFEVIAYPALEGDLLYFDTINLQGRDDYVRHIDVIIKMYETILDSDEDTAGNALRYMYTQN